MLAVVSYGFLAGWAVTTVLLVFAVGRVRDRPIPRTTSWPLAVVAGAVWPVLAIGALEYAGVVAAASVMADRDRADPEFRHDDLPLLVKV